MKGFSEKANSLLEQGSNFIYCFRLHMSETHIICAVEAQHNCVIDGEEYMASMHFCLEHLESNDCAEDRAIISANMHVIGDCKIDKLLGVRLDLLLYFPQHDFIEHYKSLYVSEVQEDGLIVRLHMQSIAQKLHQTMLPIYSKTCRANFGDCYCQVDAEAYQCSLLLDEIYRESIVRFQAPGGAEQNIAGDILTIEGIKFQSNIIWIGDNQLKLGSIIKGSITSLKHVLPCHAILKAVCDKKLATCVQRYDNALNFRGEPFIPGFEQFRL